MRHIGFDECDSTEEVCGWFNKVFANQEQMEVKILQLSKRVEALEPKEVPKVEDVIKKAKPKKKGRTMKKGFALTRVLAVLMLVAAMVGLCYAAYIPSDITYEIADNPELLTTYLRDVTLNMASDSYLFTPTTAANAPPLASGRVFYNTDAAHLQISLDGIAWTNIDTAGGNSLDTAYDLSEAITVDGTAVTLTVPLAAANPALILVSNDTTSDPDVLVIDQNSDLATVTAIQIDSAAGYDIRGTTDTWYVSNLGVATLVGLDVGASYIVMENDETIINDTNHEIQFGDSAANYEDISIVFGNNDNIISLATDTGAALFEFGVFEDVNGIENIIFDNASCSITLDGNTDGQDLTISHTADAGTDNSSLVLTSAGTGDDALIISSTVAGIDVDAAGSIVITSTENAADSIVIQSTIGGIDIRSDAAGAGEDIDITSTAGSVNIASTEDFAGAITLTTNGGTAETIIVTNTQGNTAGAITIVGTAGGIDVDAVDDIIITVASTAGDDDLALIQTGGVDAGITLAAAGTGADAIDLNASAGGIDLDAALGVTINNAGGASDITLDSALGSVNIIGGQAATDAVNIDATGAAGGIDLDTTNGGITLTTAGAINGDITITAADVITITSADEDGGSIDIGTTAGAASTVHVHNEAGTGAAAIALQADVGGITLLSDTTAGDILIDAENTITLIAADLDAAGIDIGVNGDATSTLHIHNVAGTDAASIGLVSTLGGVTVTSNLATADGINLNAIAGGVDIDSALQLNLEGTQAAATAVVINASDAAGGISLQTGVATGILINTATFEHKVKYFPISAGLVSATEVIVGGGMGLPCVGLAAGVDEIGSTEGYASVDTDTDYVRFSIPLPDDFVDTGAAADLIINFDLHETGAAVEINIVAQIYEYDGTANVVAVVNDTLTIGADAARAMETFDVLTTGIGAVAGVHQGDHLIFVLSSVAAEDDFNIYGIEMIYRCGLAATQ